MPEMAPGFRTCKEHSLFVQSFRRKSEKDFRSIPFANNFLPRMHKGTKMHEGFIGYDGAKFYLPRRHEGAKMHKGFIGSDAQRFYWF
jgi:hypothetical protein